MRCSGAAPETRQRRAEGTAEGGGHASALAGHAAAAVGLGGEDEVE
jgi:hypothetical protein